MIGTVDPSINGCACAVFKATELQAAAYVPCRLGKNWDPMMRVLACASLAANWFKAHGPIDLLVVEWPKIYMDLESSKGDRNHMLDLAGIDAAIAAELGIPAKRYIPKDWKGTLDGDVLIERIKARLDDTESARVELPAPSLEHNVWDSIGIGLKFTGRLERLRIIAR